MYFKFLNKAITYLIIICKYELIVIIKNFSTFPFIEITFNITYLILTYLILLDY